eukprot:5905194-Ditylum_brightwellii.AAC.1
MLPAPPRTCVVSKIGQCSKKSQILEATKIMSNKWPSGGGHPHPIWHILTNILGTITITTNHKKLTRSKKSVENVSGKRSMPARQIP